MREIRLRTNHSITTVGDLIKALYEYPAELEIFMDTGDDMPLHRIKSISWEEGGVSVWLELSTKKGQEDGN